MCSFEPFFPAFFKCYRRQLGLFLVFELAFCGHKLLDKLNSLCCSSALWSISKFVGDEIGCDTCDTCFWKCIDEVVILVSVIKPSKEHAVLKVLLCDDNISYNPNIDVVFIV